MKELTDKEKLENHKDFWELVNVLSAICYDAIGEKSLYPDDIMGALEIVKMDITKEHIIAVMEEKFKSKEFLKEVSNDLKEIKILKTGKNAA